MKNISTIPLLTSQIRLSLRANLLTSLTLLRGECLGIYIYIYIYIYIHLYIVYPGSNSFVPTFLPWIQYPLTPDLIFSYPSSNPLVPTFAPWIYYPRPPDLIPSYPRSNSLVPWFILS